MSWTFNLLPTGVTGSCEKVDAQHKPKWPNSCKSYKYRNVEDIKGNSWDEGMVTLKKMQEIIAGPNQ